MHIWTCGFFESYCCNKGTRTPTPAGNLFTSPADVRYSGMYAVQRTEKLIRFFTKKKALLKIVSGATALIIKTESWSNVQAC